ncbi:MAG: DUF421 domain-containing protein [Eubacteriales bacterium]
MIRISSYLNICIELVVGYISLFIIAKVIGKTLLTQITPFDFICAIVLSELVGNGLYDDEVGVSKILLAVGLWGILIYTTEFITQKFRGSRKLLEGNPAILINKGKIVFNELKKNHIDLDQLRHLLRSKNAFSIREVEYAILETDGTLNVMKKPQYDFPTRLDTKISSKPVQLPVNLITDGELIMDNLQETGFTEEWLLNQLDKRNLTIKSVLYADWKEGEGLFIQTY